VRLATHKPSGREFAVKVIDRTSEEITEADDQLIEQEVNIVSSLRHPHIIQLVEHMTSTNFYYIVLEYCPGGELFDQIAKRTCYSEVDARDIIRIVCDAISYCHSNGIVHRDLKPENLLLSSTIDSDAEIKISDFGMSAITTQGSTLEEFCGTPDYMAPELINRLPYGAPVDMWAIGVITYCLLGGYPVSE
jgi:calcium/calmodulin-dependent protein kinase I